MDTANNTTKEKILLAFVGMPGAGKSEAAFYLKDKNIPFIRFGDLTDKELKEKGIDQTPENEEEFRENIRKELGMAAYAIKAEPRIEQELRSTNYLAIDGLYSWEEYKYLKEKFPGLKLINVYAEPTVRYQRLAQRTLRPFTEEQAQIRDISEIEKINKAGPIARADFLIENNSENIEDLHKKIDQLLERLGVTK